MATVKSDKQIKTEATQAERRRVFENMNLPPRRIVAECSNGIWIREPWRYGLRFGWENWKLA